MENHRESYQVLSILPPVYNCGGKKGKDLDRLGRHVEKVATVTGNNSLTIAYQCSQGTVSNFIQRWLDATPQTQQVWETLNGIINYPSELQFPLLAHIIKLTVCYGRVE